MNLRIGTFRCASALALLIAGFLAIPASAAVVLVDEDRRVSSSGDVGSTTSFEAWTRTENSQGDFGVFDFTVDETRLAGNNSASARADITSNITTTEFVATGSASSRIEVNESGSFSSPHARGFTEFEVEFDVVEPVLFEVVGNLSFEALSGSGRGSVFFNLDEQFSSDFINVNFGDSSIRQDLSRDVWFSILLDPSRYVVRATALTDLFGAGIGMPSEAVSTFDLTMRFTPFDEIGNPHVPPIPVPGAVWLFASALGVFGVFRKAKNA